MLVSWNWLQDSIPVSAPPDEVVARLMMAGLNHEETTRVGNDWAIDLEITSNRPDCLGHLGIAREVSVLFGVPLSVPAAQITESAARAGELTKVRIDCPELCASYTARILRGVKVGPSPKWLVDRLATIGVAPVNNVVDVTNYVMFECGQPLHAFDLAKLRGREIRVREARQGETLVAIDHKTYTLEPGMCVIADAELPVALAGVMGGESTEVSTATTELLIESAAFAPLSVRTTARRLNLHSPSSYRFERGVDEAGLDWASRRCCELIQQIAGGEIAAGVVAAGQPAPTHAPITLRFSQIKRVLGIDVSPAEVTRILAGLGLQTRNTSNESITVKPPTWRRDLSREIDLIEEVARIYGYDKIPEDVAVPMTPSHRRREDRILSRLRGVLTAAGFDEAFTASVVPQAWTELFSPWSADRPLVSSMPMLKGQDHLETSLIPSILDARRYNEAVSNPVIELFETARIYLPRPGQLPHEQWTLALTSGADFVFVKGVVESLLDSVGSRVGLTVEPAALPHAHPQRCAELRVDGKRLGFLAELSPAGQKAFGLRGPTTLCELDLDLVAELVQLIPQYSELSPYPAISRDLNLIVDESVRWADLSATVREAGGPWMESLTFREIYRDAQKDGRGKKRMLFSCSFRAPDRTFTSEEADRIRDQIVADCERRHAAKLLA